MGNEIISEQILAYINCDGYSTFNNSCYKAFLNQKSFGDAQSECHANYGELTSIHSYEVYTIGLYS